MITQFFLSSFVNLASFFIKFMPSADPNVLSGLSTATSTLASYVEQAKVFLPDNFAFVATSILALEGILIGWKATKWILANVSLGLFKK